MAVFTWHGTVSADWTDPLNWDTLSVPGTNDDATTDDVFNNPLTLTGDIAIGNLRISDSWTAGFTDGGFTITLNGAGVDTHILYVSDDAVNSWAGKVVLAGSSNKLLRTSAQGINDLDISGSVTCEASTFEFVVNGIFQGLNGGNLTLDGNDLLCFGPIVLQASFTFTSQLSVVECTDWTSACTISPAGGWTLTASGSTRVMTAGTVANCDASGSAGDITATGATDGGGNSANIIFAASSQNIDPGSIATAEALGAPLLAMAIAFAAIATAEAFGAPAMAMAIDVPAIASAEALGSPSLAMAIDVPAIASAEALGALVVSQLQAIDLPAIASAEVFGFLRVARCACPSTDNGPSLSSRIADGVRQVLTLLATAGLEYRGPDTAVDAFAELCGSFVLHPDRPEPELFDALRDAAEVAVTTATLKAASDSDQLDVGGYVRETEQGQRTWSVIGKSVHLGQVIYRLRRRVIVADDADAGVDRGSAS